MWVHSKAQFHVGIRGAHARIGPQCPYLSEPLLLAALHHARIALCYVLAWRLYDRLTEARRLALGGGVMLINTLVVQMCRGGT